MYLWHILTSSDSSLIKQVFYQQCESPLRTDWATMVQKNMKEINLSMSFEEISLMKKTKFKNKIKDLCEKACLSDYLLQKSRLSKGKTLSYNTLKMQTYFKSKNCLSADSMRKIYALRTRSLPLKCNAPSKYTDRLCLAPGCLEEDQEEHVYECAYLSEEKQVVQQ